MATAVILVRHAVCGHGADRLLGRTPAVPLTPAGQRQAERLASLLASRSIGHIQSSPQLRARQTAQPIADRLALSVEIVAAMDEIDVGAWTGRSFARLVQEPDWHRWNSRRSSARPPGGEAMIELRNRVLGHLTRVPRTCPADVLAIVSHAEPIRAAIMHYRGIPFDDFASVRIDHASCTELQLHEGGGVVVYENRTIEALEAA